MLTTLLIDADIYAFAIAATSEKKYQFSQDSEPCIQIDDWSLVSRRVDAAMAQVKAQLQADELIVCLSCPTDEGFRKAILPSYKANRDYASRPVHLQPIKDYFASAYRTYQRPTLEADDCMGILSTHPRIVKGRKIIVSEDKDMLTIPGWLFNPRKNTKPVLVTPAAADEYHLLQALVGDTCDNYKGCPGIGPIKAEVLLRTYARTAGITQWAAVVSAFRAKGLTEDDALLQARVARILRHTEYNFKDKHVRLWTPAP